MSIRRGSGVMENIKRQLLSKDEIDQLAEIFKVLGDQTRIGIISTLSEGERCVQDISATLGMGISAVSHQLRILRGARLVKYRREGKHRYYSLDDEHVMTLFGMALEHIRHD
ncbi:MAG: helix-turn-helix transcriptional regulator [Firmicutes bacterium]|nr:helix-turn-helix transcriptional regulator [Bacillota bacterium]